MTRLKNWLFFRGKKDPESLFPLLFRRFQNILKRNNEILELIADMGDKMGGNFVFDRQYLVTICQRLSDLVYKLIYDLNMLTSQKYMNLYNAFERIQNQIQADLTGSPVVSESSHTISYDAITRDDLENVGSKNANLSELRNVLELPTPDGFAITTRTFYDFMVHNELLDTVQKIVQKREKNADTFAALSKNLQNRILDAEIPLSILRDIRRTVEQLRRKDTHEPLYFAVRSSAIGEDTEHSFAGQYKSFLNIPEDQLPGYYKKVVASAYSPGAWEYRIARGFQEHEIAMAVGCQSIIHPKCSGIVYTMDPLSPEKEVLVIAATWGLGVQVVEGRERVDRYLLSRDAPHSARQINIVHKETMLVPDPAGGTKTIEVPKELQDAPCLKASQFEELAHTALKIERYLKRPQDIEWAFDENGKLIILQTRMLQVHFSSEDDACQLHELTQQHTVILSGKGDVVQRGIAHGRAFVIQKDEDLDNIPYGSILVARHTSPRLAKVIHRAQGILTDRGSPIGHMATVAREFRIPTVVNTGIASKVLSTGQEITLDASQNVVYDGMIRELCYYERMQEDVFEESYEYRLLNRILKKIAPLKLVEPHDQGFVPERCQTFHDIVRFVHEKAVEDLMNLSEKYRNRSQQGLKRLEMDVPLGLFVLDIGGGIDASSKTRSVMPEQIKSRPMKAFLMGLADSGLWTTDPVSMDLGSFMSSVTRTISASPAGATRVGRNLVVLGEKYMNVSLHLGYHFNIIDAYIGENINDNYAYFRFIGGVTEITRRSRRASFIADVLARYDFKVEVRGDLVIGSLKKFAKEQMDYKVALLGALVAYTRQLDVLMRHDEHINHYVEDFTNRWPVVEL